MNPENPLKFKNRNKTLNLSTENTENSQNASKSKPDKPKSLLILKNSFEKRKAYSKSIEKSKKLNPEITKDKNSEIKIKANANFQEMLKLIRDNVQAKLIIQIMNTDEPLPLPFLLNRKINKTLENEKLWRKRANSVESKKSKSFLTDILPVLENMPQISNQLINLNVQNNFPTIIRKSKYKKFKTQINSSFDSRKENLPTYKFIKNKVFQEIKQSLKINEKVTFTNNLIEIKSKSIRINEIDTLRNHMEKIKYVIPTNSNQNYRPTKINTENDKIEFWQGKICVSQFEKIEQEIKKSNLEKTIEDLRNKLIEITKINKNKSHFKNTYFFDEINSLQKMAKLPKIKPSGILVEIKQVSNLQNLNINSLSKQLKLSDGQLLTVNSNLSQRLSGKLSDRPSNVTGFNKDTHKLIHN